MARQFTGRIVTVNNGAIFDEPVYNYSRDFPFLFEEIAVGIDYASDYETAERILLETVRARTTRIEELSDDAREHLRRVFDLTPPDVEPRVYYRMTDNWVELSVRFLCMTHEIRALKDGIFRELLARFKAHNIGIASSTYDIVGFPPVRVVMEPPPAPGTPR
jgi:small-conductance mechanosensitive channel